MNDEDQGIDLDRRQFIQSVGVASALGAVAMTHAFTPQSVTAQAQDEQAGGPEYSKPDALKPLAQLDARFPVSYQKSVPKAMRVLTQYFEALSRRDLEGMARVLHFPFALCEGTEPIVIESERDFVDSPPPSLDPSGTGESQILTGSYDLLNRLELQTFSPVGAGLTMSFIRYTPEGHALEDCLSLDGLGNGENLDWPKALRPESAIEHEQAVVVTAALPNSEPIARQILELLKR